MRKFIIASAVLTSLATAQFQQVIPPGNAAVDGSSSTAYPWGSTTGSYRVQYVYDSSHFTNAGINAPILINRIRWRANASATTTTWTGGSWANCIVSLSTSPVDYTAVTTTFASNHGPDLTTVYTGPVTLIPGAGNGTGVPAPYFVDIAFSTPFLYDASLGDLNVDLQKDGTWVGGTTTSLDCETGATTSLTSRIYSLTGYLNTTGSTQQNVSVVMELNYSPAAGLYPSFSATPTTGAAPLNVQFTDHTYTSDPGGVTSWAWDLNGDGVIDSNLQNPSYVYTSCGDYNVTLTTTDATHGAATYTQNAYIVVDPITANFTATPTAGGNLPLVVQFTDTSSNATGWSWDFDNDGIADSSLQNPVWAYVNPGFYSVALTTTNACRTATVVKQNLIYAGGVILPAAVQNVDGSSSTSYPLHYTSQSHVQEIFDSSQFTGAGISSPILISAIRFRANSATATWVGDVASNLQVMLSTSPVDYLAMTTTYANNQGIDLATVYNAPLVIPAGSSAAGVPGPFFATVPFTTPFLYDASQGDLTLEYLCNGITATANTPVHDAHSTAGQALARRVYNTGNNLATTGTLYTTTGEIATVIALDYAPAAGLHPAFTSDVTSGASPLTVHFTDQTYTSDPGGVVAWQWDFDNDGIVDSTLQNPTWTYTSCGSYTVSLTVVDASNPPATLTRPGYISTDVVAADFSATLLPGGVMQFTDLTTPAATAWAWDFDGDGIVDSNAQNPVFVYPTTNAYNCTLTASRLCGPASVKTRSVRAVLAVSTMFTGGNGGSSLWGVLFDIDVTSPTGIVITGMDHNISSALGTPFTVDIYLTPSTYVGAQTNSALWRRVSSGAGTSAGSNIPSSTNLATPIFLGPGRYGMMVYYTGASMSYTNGNGTAVPGSGTNQTFGNGDLTLLLGESRTSLWGTGVNAPRIWNGAIYYDKAGFADLAGYTFFNAGCAGSTGMSNLTASGAPVLGTTLAITVNNLPSSLAVMLLGFSNTTSPNGPLPIDLSVIGMTGCPLRVANHANFVTIGAGNTATWNLPIPNSGVFTGVRFYNQAVVLDLLANSLGLVMSDAAAATVGH